MPKFLFVYHSASNDEQNYSPEEMQQFMQTWMKWIEEGYAKGWMLDPGDALLPDGKVVDPDKVVHDGPFAESKEIVGGYTIVNAETLAAAAEIAKSCPILMTCGKVEVRQLMGIAPPSE